MISRIINILLCFSIFVRADSLFKYQVIIDKKPFGEPPKKVEPLVEPAKPSVVKPFISNLRLTALNTDSEGRVWVGFEDISLNKSYYLSVGMTEDGITVVRAIYEEGKVLFAKGGETAWLSMYTGGFDLSGGEGVEVVPPPPSASTNFSSTMSYAEQLKRRKEILMKLEEGRQKGGENVPKLTGEELEKHLREYNLRAIRTGMPPLPIQLTPEEDAKLVEEGVLPPR